MYKHCIIVMSDINLSSIHNKDSRTRMQVWIFDFIFHMQTVLDLVMVCKPHVYTAWIELHDDLDSFQKVIESAIWTISESCICMRVLCFYVVFIDLLWQNHFDIWNQIFGDTKMAMYYTVLYNAYFVHFFKAIGIDWISLLNIFKRLFDTNLIYVAPFKKRYQ